MFVGGVSLSVNQS